MNMLLRTYEPDKYRKIYSLKTAYIMFFQTRFEAVIYLVYLIHAIIVGFLVLY